MTLAVAPQAPTRVRTPRRAPETPKAVHPAFSLPHFRQWASDLILDDGTPWHLEPYQEAFIEDLFSGKPENWLIVPEGNGKTTLVAGIALYHCAHEPSAKVPIAASSVQQAEIMYGQAEAFVMNSPRLHASTYSPAQKKRGKLKLYLPQFGCRPGIRRIEHANGGWIRVYASDDATADGVIYTLAILDELHRHKDLRLYGIWRGKADKRGAQLIAISTAGEPDSEFEKQREAIRQRASDVRRERAFLRAETEALILHEWAVPEGGNVEDMAVVKSANPFSRITPESLGKKFNSPTMTLQHWRRFNCNLPTRGNNAAIQEVEWAKAATKDTIPEGEPISVGIDIAWKYDTTAVVPLYFRDNDYRLLGPATILVPPRDGTMLDPNLIKTALREIHTRNPIHTAVMDLSKGGPELAFWIEEQFGSVVVEHSETNASLVEDYDAFMEALRNGWLRHSGDAGLTSHVMNAVAKLTPTGDARFDRPAEARRSGEQDRRVIDALAAAAMVHGQASKHEPEVIWTAV